MAVTAAAATGSSAAAAPSPDGGERLRGWAARSVRAWVVVIVVVGLAGSFGYFGVHQPGDALSKPLLIISPVVGALVALRRRGNPIGWILLVSGSAGVVGAGIAEDRVVWWGPGRASAGAALLDDVLWPLTFPLMCAALLWFPDGRLPSRRWRPVAAVTVAALGAVVLAEATATWPAGEHPGLHNPLGTPLIHAVAPLPVLIPVQSVLVLVAVASVLVRHRSADAETRDRIRWVAWAGTVALITSGGVGLYSVAAPVPAWVEGAAPFPIVVGVPVCITIAVLRHQLFDIDVLLNRTLLYAVLSVAVLAGYLAVIAALGQIGGLRHWVPAAAAGLVTALVFHPIRMRAQRLADRVLFGDRRDPLTVLATVSGSVLGAEAPFTALVEAIAQSLRLHHVALDLHGESEQGGALTRVAVHGADRGAPVVEIPLTHEGTALGVLAVAARSPGDPLRPDELTLLNAVASQVAATVQTQRLAGALQRSRGRIVHAAEEERRRLRRDLHDGLGARLTAIGYVLEAATRQSASGPVDPAVAGTVCRAQAEVGEAVAELRRVIDDLRPGPLDDLGLVDALAAAARRPLDEAGISAQVHLDLPDGVTLAAGTEVALYRIGVEAVTNIARHAHARTCRIDLQVGADGVVLRVQDDGTRPGTYHRPGGVGVASMRERAAELGGTLSITANHGSGTTVEARIPIGAMP